MRSHIIIRSVGVFLLTLAAVISFSGCNSYGNQPEGTTAYTAQFPYSAQEYMSFLNKEIVPVTNQLTTHMILAQNVAQGTYPASEALASAQSGLRIIQEVRDNIDIMQPAYEYDEERLDTLRILDNIEATFSSYIEELGKAQPDGNLLNSYSEIMQSDYLTLTGMFNIYWQ